MAVTALSTIKNWFKKNNIPSQEQFWDVWDSFRHRSEKVPATDVSGLDSLLQQKAEKEAFTTHESSASSHSQLFGTKVDKVEGKVLSEHDYTTADKTIVSSVATKESISNKTGDVAGNLTSTEKFAHIKGITDWVMANVAGAPFLGSVGPSATPSGTGKAYWFASQSGTYSNFGSLVVSANSFAVISRNDAGVFSISQTVLSLTEYSKISDVQNTLASLDSTKPLAALQGKLLNENKADLVFGTNLFNINSGLVDNGKYVAYTNGVHASNALYTCTGLIEIPAGTTQLTLTYKYHLVFKDAAGVYISGIQHTGTTANQTIAVPGTAKYIDCTLLAGAVSTFMIVVGATIPGSYIPYQKVLNPNQLDLSKYVKTPDLPILIENKASLVSGANLFNKNSGLVEIGKYVNYITGAHTSNATYTATGKIELPAGTTQITMTYKHQIAFFNASGVYIGGSNSSDLNKTQNVPVGALYVDCTLLASAGLDTFMISAGASTPSIYMAYKKVVDKKNLEIFSSQIIKDLDADADLFKLFLPKEVCIAVGRTIELYNNQVSWCGNINDYHFLWSGVGKSMTRKWTCSGIIDNIGTYTLNLKVFNKNNILVKQASTVVKIVSDNIVAPFSVCAIGDSLTNNKPWVNEIKSLASNNITFAGTRSALHEGRSGATAGYYLGNNSYTFDSNGIVGNDGRPQDLNPFWNPSTFDVDFGYYKSNYNINPSKLLIWLGTNGISTDPTANAVNIKTFIDKIRATGGSTIPIFVVHTLFRGNQDGIGKQTGIDGYVANSTYKLEEDLKVFNLQEKILADLGAYANVYLVPVSTCHDSEFNFGAVETTVNPRASQVEYLPVEATHPQTQGYLQIADIIFSAMAANQ